MSKKAQQQIVRLRRDLLRHNKLYYIDAKPELTDLEYDQLLEELHKLEQLYPEQSAICKLNQRHCPHCRVHRIEFCI